MRRLDGVDHVELDTVEQYATIYWADPAPIDFGEVLDAAVSAAFEVNTMTLTSRGTISQAPCENCARPHGVIQLHGTGQSFSLAGAPENRTGEIPFVATVSNWGSAEPQLSLRD